MGISNHSGITLLDDGVPPGGTTGQVLKKASNADFDTVWGAGGGGGGSVAGVTGVSPIVVDNTDAANPIVTLPDLTGFDTGDLPDSNNKRYVTDAQLVVIGNTSGTNTGDQTSVSGNAGTATALQTPRAIYGNNFDGSAALTQIIASTYGGTGNGFAKLSGPAGTEKTFTLPNASATILTDNAVVTGAQGGTGVSNSGKTITLANNLITAGNFALTLTQTNTTNVTLPTTGTLATLAGSEALTNKSVNGVTLVNGGTATKYLSEGGTYTTPSGGGSTPKVFTDTSNTFDLNSQISSSATQVDFKPNGLEMYVLGTDDGVLWEIFQYTLSVAWDVSTATFTNAYDFSAVETSPECFFIKSDGTKFWITGNQTAGTIFQFSMSTPWDISTSSYDSVSLDAGFGQTAFFAFVNSGNRILMSGYSSNTNSYDLPAAYDISSATFECYNQVSDLNTGLGTPPKCFNFNTAGTDAVIAVDGGNLVLQIKVAAAFDIRTIGDLYTSRLGDPNSAPNYEYIFVSASFEHMCALDMDRILYQYDMS